MDKGVHLLQLTSSCVMYYSYTFFSVKYSHYIMHAACPNLSGTPDDQNYDFKYVKLFQMLFSSI